MNNKLFFTGGSGFVGQGTIPMLVEAGYEVYGLARSPNSAAMVGQVGATPVLDDLTKLSNNATKALRYCDTVIHSAAHMEMDYDYEKAYAINVEATKNLLQLAKENGVKRFIYISAAPVAPGSPIVNLTEEQAKKGLPIHVYPKTKAIAEKAVLAENTPEFSTLSLRPPAIWGKNNPHMEEVFDRIKAGQWMWIGGGRQILSTIHVENLASAMIAAIKSDKSGEAYFVTDGDRRSMRTTFEALIKAHGYPPEDKEFPLGVASFMGSFFHGIWKLFGLKSQPPIPALAIRLMGREFSVSDEKARRELNYQNVINFEEGIRKLQT